MVDENGKRCRTEEEIERSKSDKEYDVTTGVGFYNYPFPSYGMGVEDPTGNTCSVNNRDTVRAEYNAEEQAACEVWGVEFLTDIFPQPEEFEVPEYPPVWGLTKPAAWMRSAISWTRSPGQSSSAASSGIRALLMPIMTP